MRRSLKRCAALLTVGVLCCGAALAADDPVLNPGTSWPPVPAVIGHRGAPALRPEHTLASYEQAIDDGADVIEPDLVSTRDGFLVARHENEIGGTTDVSAHPEFAARRMTKRIDGASVTGWFTEDFTLAELKTLRARERIPAQRPANLAYNDQFAIPTLQEVIELAQRRSRELGRTIGIYPETKHPGYFKSIGLPLERRLVEQLSANGYRGKAAAVLIQSFEVANLKELRGMTEIRLVQLVDNPKSRGGANRPADFAAAGDARTYADMITPAGLAQIATYADIVSAFKDVIVPRDGFGHLGQPSSFVRDAHAAGLQVHTWTMRPENSFLPTDLRSSEGKLANQRGDAVAEIGVFLRAGVDGFFTDDPATGRAAVKAFNAK